MDEVLYPMRRQGDERSTLTTRELAAKLATAEFSSEAAFERINYWTKAGLLTPTGIQHPGSGSRRVFDRIELLKADFLNQVTNVGLSIGGQKTAVAALESQLPLFLAEPDAGWLLVIKKPAPEIADIEVLRLDNPEEAEAFQTNIMEARVALLAVSVKPLMRHLK